ncbi:MAG: 16S rRNA (cytidine(1402)-2'-O)-methyltransferase [Tissierellia bacterium]|nr:16S rRNA (cytidine(1402)-2'-O)-methyltransferase [Tissierellia bacterium]
MEKGKLYVIPTPIGNLEDMTLRGLRLLREADLILCEDTRESGKLLSHYGIENNKLSYHKFNEKSRSDEIINRLIQGENIALISDQGSPGISDPGQILIQEALHHNIEPVVLPGATAMIPAMISSGFSTDCFNFDGFIPRDGKERKDFMAYLQRSRRPVIFYESVHRIHRTLMDLKKIIPRRAMALCRELTKTHEEILRGRVEEICEISTKRQWKGEFVVIIDGDKEEEFNLGDEEIKTLILAEMKKGIRKSQAVKLIAKTYHLNKNQCYELSLELENE